MAWAGDTPGDEVKAATSSGSIQFEALRTPASSAPVAGATLSRSDTPTPAAVSTSDCRDVECPEDPCQDCPIPVPVPPTGCFLLDGSDYVRKEITRDEQGNPELGGSYSRIRIDTHLQCIGPDMRSVNVQAYLVDRTPGRDGQILAWGSVSGGAGTYVGYGLIDLYDEDYPVGRYAEVVLEWQATLWSGTWGGCGTVPSGLRQVRCDGVGGSTIYAGLGTGTFSTGLVDCSPVPIPPEPPLIPPTPGQSGGPGERTFDWGPGDCGPVLAAAGISTAQAPAIRCIFSVQQPHLEGTLIGGYARIRCINRQTLAPIKMAVLSVTATMWKRTPWVLPTSPPEQYTPIIETTRHNSNLAKSEIEQFIVYSCPGPEKAWEYVTSAAFFAAPAGRYHEGPQFVPLGGISNFILC